MKRLLYLFALSAMVVLMLAPAAFAQDSEAKAGGAEAKAEEKKAKAEQKKEEKKKEEKKEMPKSGGPGSAPLLALGAGTLLVGGGLLIRRIK